MDDKRKVRHQGIQYGELAIDMLYRMVARGEIDHNAEFWSPRAQTWRPLAGIIIDLSPKSFDEQKSLGFTEVEIIGSGDEDCPACTALQNKHYPIDRVPELPPSGCTCVPWCRSMAIVVPLNLVR